MVAMKVNRAEEFRVPCGSWITAKLAVKKAQSSQVCTLTNKGKTYQRFGTQWSGPALAYGREVPFRGEKDAPNAYKPTGLDQVVKFIIFLIDWIVLH